MIGWDGRVYEGRWARNDGPWEVPSSENTSGAVVVAAHTQDFNTGSLGVALMGNFVNVGAPKVMKDALVGLLAWEVDRHELDPTSKHSYVNPATGKKKWLPVVGGHRDAGQTAYPGDKVYDKFPRLSQEDRRTGGSG